MRRDPHGARSRDHRNGWRRKCRAGDYENGIRVHAHRRHAGRRPVAEDLLRDCHARNGNREFDSGGGRARRRGAIRAIAPAKVGVRIGEFAGVDTESLRFCFEVLTRTRTWRRWSWTSTWRTGTDELKLRIWNWKRSPMNRVAIEKKVLSENDQIAARLREALRGQRHAGAEPDRLAGLGQDHAARKDAGNASAGTRAPPCSPAISRPTTTRGA